MHKPKPKPKPLVHQFVGITPLSCVGADKQEKMLRQRRRLVQIFHSYNCKDEDCPIKWCREMREILAHVRKCDDPSCYYPMCFSTKCILEHYYTCEGCQLCEQAKRLERINNIRSIKIMQFERNMACALCSMKYSNNAKS